MREMRDRVDAEDRVEGWSRLVEENMPAEEASPSTSLHPSTSTTWENVEDDEWKRRGAARLSPFEHGYTFYGQCTVFPLACITTAIAVTMFLVSSGQDHPSWLFMFLGALIGILAVMVILSVIFFVVIRIRFHVDSHTITITKQGFIRKTTLSFSTQHASLHFHCTSSREDRSSWLQLVVREGDIFYKIHRWINNSTQRRQFFELFLLIQAELALRKVGGGGSRWDLPDEILSGKEAQLLDPYAVRSGKLVNSLIWMPEPLVLKRDSSSSGSEMESLKHASLRETNSSTEPSISYQGSRSRAGSVASRPRSISVSRARGLSLSQKHPDLRFRDVPLVSNIPYNDELSDKSATESQSSTPDLQFVTSSSRMRSKSSFGFARSRSGSNRRLTEIVPSNLRVSFPSRSPVSSTASSAVNSRSPSPTNIVNSSGHSDTVTSAMGSYPRGRFRGFSLQSRHLPSLSPLIAGSLAGSSSANGENFSSESRSPGYDEHPRVLEFPNLMLPRDDPVVSTRRKQLESVDRRRQQRRRENIVEASNVNMNSEWMCTTVPLLGGILCFDYLKVHDFDRFFGHFSEHKESGFPPLQCHLENNPSIAHLPREEQSSIPALQRSSLPVAMRKYSLRRSPDESFVSHVVGVNPSDGRGPVSSTGSESVSESNLVLTSRELIAPSTPPVEQGSLADPPPPPLPTYSLSSSIAHDRLSRRTEAVRSTALSHAQGRIPLLSVQPQHAVELDDDAGFEKFVSSRQSSLPLRPSSSSVS